MKLLPRFRKGPVTITHRGLYVRLFSWLGAGLTAFWSWRDLAGDKPRRRRARR
jgi:hypothetical protein